MGKNVYDIFSGSLDFIMCNNACFMLKYLFNCNKKNTSVILRADTYTRTLAQMEMEILKFSDRIFMLKH